MSYYLRFLLRGEGKSRFYYVILLIALFLALLSIFFHFLFLLFDYKYHLFFFGEKVSNSINYRWPESSFSFKVLTFFICTLIFFIPAFVFFETLYNSLFVHKTSQSLKFLLDKIEKRAKKRKKISEITLNKAEDLISLLVNQNLLKLRLLLKFNIENLGLLEQLKFLLFTEFTESKRIRRKRIAEHFFLALNIIPFIFFVSSGENSKKILFDLFSLFNLSFNFLNIYLFFVVTSFFYYLFLTLFFLFKGDNFFITKEEIIKFLLLKKIEKSLKKVEKFKEKDKDIEIIFTPYFFSKIRRRKKLVVNFESENIKT